MKVKELIEHLSKLDQEALCVYANDDEGNGYCPINLAPTQGKFNQIMIAGEGDFVTDATLEDDDDEEWKAKAVKAVCVN